MGVPTALSAALILPALGQIPGVNGDEPWIIGRIAELRDGARPLSGMTFYTAAMHQYLTWPFVEALGATPLAIRLPGALLNVATVALVALTMLRLYGAWTALVAGCFLATAPAFVTMSRFGIEVPALSPFFAAVAFACLAAKAGRAPRPALALLGGVALGALPYNHIVLLPVPLTLLAVLLAKHGVRWLRSRLALAALAGFVLGFGPRLVTLAEPGALRMWLSEGNGLPHWPDFLPLFGVLLRSWDGGLIYRRFVGESRIPVLPYPELVLLVALALRYRVRRRGMTARAALRGLLTPLERYALLAVLIAVALTTRIAPHLSIRYVIVLHAAIPVLLAVVLAPLLLDASPTLQKSGRALAAGVVALNLLYLGANFFVPFVRGDGGLSVFRVGTRLIETSNHFVRSDGLYAALLAHGVRRVETDGFLESPLRLYDCESALEWGPPEPAHRSRSYARVKSAVVFYNGRAWLGPEPPMPHEDARRLGETLRRGRLRLKRDRSFPPLFRVYVADARPSD